MLGYLSCGLIYYCKFSIKAKRQKENFTIQTQPFPIFNHQPIPVFNPQLAQNNLTNNDYHPHYFNNTNLALKSDLRNTVHYDSNIMNTYKEASFNRRYYNYHRNPPKNINTSSFYESPIKIRKSKKHSRSEIKNHRTKRYCVDNDANY